MVERQLTGTRIRERRQDQQISQSDLARAVGISPSYLNLIEHNRRRVGGKLLHDLAQVLEVAPAALSEGAEGMLVSGLWEAAAAEPAISAEVSRAEEFAGRLPGWAALVVEQARRLTAMQAQVQVLSDRLTHDTDLASALHQVISAVTAIHSSASILVDAEDPGREWTARFLGNIHEDSEKLATSSRALARYLDRADSDGGTRLPHEEVERFLDEAGHYFPALETGDTAELGALVAAMRARCGDAAAGLFAQWLETARADAACLPLAGFSAVAAGLNHDPVALARHFSVELAPVLRRLALLPPGQGHLQSGLAVCDGAGALTHLKTTASFALPRIGAGCPLWPLYQALGRPGQALSALVEMPGDGAVRLRCYAIAGPRGGPSFDDPPVMEAVMLVVPATAEERSAPVRQVGPTCRFCPREACAARREPSLYS